MNETDDLDLHDPKVEAFIKASHDVTKEKPITEGTARIVYILYLVGIIFFITSIIGVVIAYIYGGDAPRWLKSHYRFQIRTFWIGVLYALIGIILILPIFGVVNFLIFGLLWAVWIIIRCVKGIRSLDQKEIHPNPTGWMF